MEGRSLIVASCLTLCIIAPLLCGCISEDGDGDFGVKWKRPVAVRADPIHADEVAERVFVEVRLFDKNARVTEWDGQLRLIVVDMLDLEMYNESYKVKAEDFKTIKANGTVDTYYRRSIAFGDFIKSRDRVKEPFGLMSKMMPIAWFELDGETLKQAVGSVPLARTDIPAALFAPNQLPGAKLVAPSVAYAGYEAGLDASGSSDDTGVANLKFYWDFGDGISFLGEEEETHTYDGPMTVTVEVEVKDPDGDRDTATALVEVRWPEDVTITDWGVVSDPGEHHNDTYVVHTIRNAAPFQIDLYHPGANLAAGDDWVWSNGSDTELPFDLDVGESVTVTEYFDLPEGFSPEVLVLWTDREYPLP